MLKQPGLSAQALAFVQQQRDLCLHDAHLPVPVTTRHTTAVSAPASLTLSSRVLTPEEADCGPRALRLACADMGMQTELAALRQAAGTSGQGTSLAGLAKAAKTLGLKGEGVQVSREALEDMPLPAIAYVNGSHFIAVLKLEGRGTDMVATVQDPNSPRTARLTREQLLRACSGYLLLLR